MAANLKEGPRRLKRRCAGLVFALIAAVVLGACGRERERDEAPAGPLTLPIEVLRDTGSAVSSGAPLVAAWIDRVSTTTPVAVTPRPARSVAPPLPEAAPETVLAETSEPAPLAIDPGLKPPLLKSAALLRLPAGHAGAATVELDVEVDERGEVADARWAGGSRDPALVEAALECARRMRFYPALRAGKPVAVWCRQRFEFEAR